MADLMTLHELALWTQKSDAEVAADPFAAEVIDKVSQLAQFLGGHDGTKLDSAGAIVPAWDLVPGPTMAPFDVRMVVLQICKRTYANPGQVIQEGNIGPIGGDRVVDAAALLTSLTDTERVTLTKYNQDGDPDATGEVFTITTTRGGETIAQSAVLYVSDDQQINLETSADPRPWMIPLFNPGDPGDPNLYDGV